MMHKIAQFQKVSYEQFQKDWMDTFQNDEQALYELYQSIQCPKRATKGSAGYDFFAPLSFTLHPNEEIKIPTGIRVKIDDGWVLACFPRSSLGFKYRMQLNNTVGIIDSDYYDSDNEGHIFIKITNDSKEQKTFTIEKGQGMIQGIFLPYGICIDDEVETIRNGGFGSTNE